jgi:xylulokinase
MVYLVGVDVGSSDCKAMVINRHGELIRSARQSYQMRYPHPGWAEQNPEDWYRGACSTIRSCLDGLKVHEVVGLSVDGPAHNVALLDQAGEVVHPTLHWSDLRSVPQSEKLERDYGDHIFRLTYCRPNPAWTLPQLVWLQEERPDVWAQVQRILVTKDYVRYRLTGEYQTDIYDAIGTQLYAVERGAWSEDLCRLLGRDTSWLPQVSRPETISGTLLPTAAADTGLPAGLPIAVGSGDSVVEALGIGVVRPGQCIVKLGTAANVNLVTDAPYPTNKSITYRHLTDGNWMTITATNAGASTMRWFRETFCRAESERARAAGVEVFDLIEQLGAGASAGSQGLLFHPYLNGERSPYWDPYLRGDFVGITMQHREHHFARAVMEGVAYSIRDCFHMVESLTQPVDTLYLIGGGAKSHAWGQILCDVLGKPLLKPVVEDAAYGAALLAGVAVGVFTHWEDATSQCAQIEHTLHPDPAAHDLYTHLFALYREVTCNLTAHYHRLAELLSTHKGESNASKNA